MYRSLYLLCSLALPALGMAYASRARVPMQRAMLPFMVSYIEVVPSSQDETIALLRQYCEVSRKEKGYMQLEVLQQNGRPSHVVLLEMWKDQKALAAPVLAGHTRQFREKCQPLSGSLYNVRLYTAVETLYNCNHHGDTSRGRG